MCLKSHCDLQWPVVRTNVLANRHNETQLVSLETFNTMSESLVRMCLYSTQEVNTWAPKPTCEDLIAVSGLPVLSVLNMFYFHSTLQIMYYS